MGATSIRDSSRAMLIQPDHCASDDARGASADYDSGRFRGRSSGRRAFRNRDCGDLGVVCDRVPRIPRILLRWPVHLCSRRVHRGGIRRSCGQIGGDPRSSGYSGETVSAPPGHATGDAVILRRPQGDRRGMHSWVGVYGLLGMAVLIPATVTYRLVALNNVPVEFAAVVYGLAALFVAGAIRGAFQLRRKERGDTKAPGGTC